MSLETGVRLGVYEILAPLGAGGMGEVYRARDTRLGRDAAIKILPLELAQLKDRLARFEQEARAASSLNHPHIVTIYEIGFEGGTPFLAMELVDGKTLRDLVVPGPLPVRRVLAIGAQIAEGLQKAHAAGIVHRDLKPENVMVSKDGFVKILDFGLAKLTRPESGVDTAMATMGGPKTASGVVMGTVDYMSPEQASGEPVDFRSDQFSLGSILYEMATGAKAFHRKTAAETMSAIIREEPQPLPELRKDAPPPLRWIVERCLAKEPDERYASTRDLAKDLASVRDHISEISSGSTASSVAARRGSRFALPALGLVLVVLGITAGRFLFRPSPPAPPSFQRLTYRKGAISNARFGADGTTVVHGGTFDGKEALYQIRIGSPESQRFDIGAEDILAVSKAGEMAVKVGPGPRGTLARAPLLGGAPRPVAEDVFWAGADWSPDGKELVVVRRVEGRTRLEYPIGTVLQEADGLGCPRFSPRGDRIAFVERDAIAVIGLDGKGKKTLASGPPPACPLAWRPDGKEIWFGGEKPGEQPALYAADLEGRSRLVIRVPGTLELFDISADGRVLIAHHAVSRVVRGVFPGAAEERDLTWLDRTTPAQLSTDGGLLLFTEDGEASPGGASVYLRKTDGSPAVRLGDGRACTFSPDREWALARVETPPPHYVLLPTGAGQLKKLPNDRFEELFHAEFLPDGRRVVFTAREKGGRVRVYLQDVGGGVPRAITPPGSAFPLHTRPLSPDGRFVFATGNTGGVLYPIDGGDPRTIPGFAKDDLPVQWTADGSVLYLISRSDRTGLWTLDLSTGKKQLVNRLDGGFGPKRLAITPDGRFYAVGRDEVSSALYVVDGLR